MRTEIYWIDTPTPGRLAIMPRPRGGDWLADEVESWRLAGVDMVVSLLTPGEISDLDLAREESLCEAHGIQFLAFPIEDRSVPSSREATVKLLAELAICLAEGKSIAIHCRQGIGRAPLIAICVLIATGLDAATAISRVSTARGVPVPETSEQKRWITAFAKDAFVLGSL